MSPPPSTHIVNLSARAVRDLRDLRAYIAAQGLPLTADRFVARVSDAIESLERGRPARGGVRELVAIAPYLIRYRVTGRVVQIIRIKHGARR